MFQKFQKIGRLSRECVVTEKLDGTNAQILLLTGAEASALPLDWILNDYSTRINSDLFMVCGSRTRVIKPNDDNYGFARWAWDNHEELAQLGPGRHFGEWWGQGIQRKYGLKEKRFSLFNTHQWSDDAVRPACCHVVPVLYSGMFDTARIEATLTLLKATGSVAAPGFMKPEGVIVFHSSQGQLFKKTCERDDKPKGQTRE